MAVSEPSSEQDEPPTSSIPPKGSTANHSANEAARFTSGQETSATEQEKGTDEFGLPVNKIRTQSSYTAEYHTASEDEGSNQRQSSYDPEIEHKAVKPEEPPPQLQEEPAPSQQEKSKDVAGNPKHEDFTEINNPAPTSSSHEHKISEAASLQATDKVLQGNTGTVSEWSHQALAPQKPSSEGKKEEEDWQSMPAYAAYDLYDDDGYLIAREAPDSDEEANAYHGLGGAGKGYTRVQVDEDAKSATSMDENTDYLFKQHKGTDLQDEDEEQRDPLAQLQATKHLLTEGQRIAYVGLTRLGMAEMTRELEEIKTTRKTKKMMGLAVESMKMWSQKMMVRLYMHMEIDSSEQIMIEQLPEHGVLSSDLTPALMQNARVKNPMAEETAAGDGFRNSMAERESLKSPALNGERRLSTPSLKNPVAGDVDAESLPPYKEHEDGAMPEAGLTSELGTGKNIDIDLRWTVLCDLFLVLLSDSLYDARSRTLLERVGKSLEVTWLDICRFEKRVTDALEMQEAANKETWDEAEHMESRRKLALKRRYMMMGLATVGGSLVIGLSAGLLAPVIGAGLAAGFTTIGVAGTSGFLGGAGGIALITSGAVVTGGTIGVRASNRRTGAVTTFEYRPLHNNKRVNLILTISGWMSGKVDDVRLPFSTVDSVMGDMYSLLWEPEMLQSMGQTINILATEALTQSIQQVLGSTILVALMASLQLPIVLSKLSYLIDNPWTVSMGRANAAGLILADSLIDRNLGARPITLVGFSLGARVIFAALRELANRGAIGLIQNVYLFGSPIVNDKDEYIKVRSVISGRFVNAYSSNDWILGYLFRATSGGVMRVAGLAAVNDVPGLENLDVTKLVNGHMAYRAAMPKLLREVGWEVESDEFTEIEDPDPENHEERQRELIHELDEARKEAEVKPGKRRFGFFKRGKLAEKKGWETYEDRKGDGDDFSTSAAEGLSGNVLFDIDAIKRELESEQIEVRQLESTLPPMKLNINGHKEPSDEVTSSSQDPHSILHSSKSYESSLSFRPKNLDDKANASQSSLPPIGSSGNPFNQGYDEYNRSQDSIKPNNSSLGATDTSKPSSEAPGEFSPISPQPPSSQRSPRVPTDLSTAASPHRHVQSNVTPPQRPEVGRHSMSSPTAGGLGLEHNGWVDEEDEFVEKEVKMTF